MKRKYLITISYNNKFLKYFDAIKFISHSTYININAIEDNKSVIYTIPYLNIEYIRIEELGE